MYLGRGPDEDADVEGWMVRLVIIGTMVIRNQVVDLELHLCY